MAQSNNSEAGGGAQKLKNDLDAVMERVQLCREIMQESPGIQYDETLAGVVGFLEACRDRMDELIEAGTQGLLTEELFERCLTVNDAVCRTLDAERTGTKIAVTDGIPDAGAAKKESKSLLDLGNDGEDEDEDKDLPVRKAPSAQVGSPQSGKAFSKPKSAQEDSLLAPYVPAPTPAAAAPVPATADPFSSADPFADFETKPLDLPAPPAGATQGAIPATTQPAPAAAAATAMTMNDLDALLAGTSVSPPPAPAAATGSAQAAAAAEFDAFLDSLGETK